MTAIIPPPITAAIALGPISQIMSPTYRFAGDDWEGEMAFLFTFYTVLPTFGPATTDPNTGATIPGPVLTQGQPRDLTGCTFSGTVEYAPPPNPFNVPMPWNSNPIPMTGNVNVGAGQATLALSQSQTQFIRQSFSLWQPSQQGFESQASLRVQARLTDSLGATTTQGVIPLFVF